MNLKSLLKKHKETLIYIFTIIFSAALLLIGFFVCVPEKSNELTSEEHDAYIASVISVDNTEEGGYSLGGGTEIESRKIEFTAIIKSLGTLNNVRVTAYQYIDELLAVSPKQVQKGDTVLINYLDMGDGDGFTWNFTEYHRSGGLIVLLIVFFALIVLFGRKKGVNTIISLVFTCLAIFAVFVPSILKGYNIYLMATLTSIFIIFMTLILVNGFNIKTICAIAGNIGGLAAAGILTVFMDSVLNLTGVVDEQSLFLMQLNEQYPIDLRAVIFGAVVIGALGATMDVAMSIASALHELAENMDKKSFKTMLKSGINIGRDAMSTMTNTLVLAYIGSSLSIVLLLVGSGQSLLTLFNLEMIVVEVLQALVGSIGILVTLPITSFLAAYMYNRGKRKGESGVGL